MTVFLVEALLFYGFLLQDRKQSRRLIRMETFRTARRFVAIECPRRSRGSVSDMMEAAGVVTLTMRSRTNCQLELGTMGSPVTGALWRVSTTKPAPPCGSSALRGLLHKRSSCRRTSGPLDLVDPDVEKPRFKSGTAISQIIFPHALEPAIKALCLNGRPCPFKSLQPFA